MPSCLRVAASDHPVNYLIMLSGHEIILDQLLLPDHIRRDRVMNFIVVCDNMSLFVLNQEQISYF